MINLLAAFKEEVFFTKKSLGQHFLTNQKVLEDITACLGAGQGDNIVEIGPGCGVLTQYLLETGANVKAVEIDDELSGFLRKYLYFYKNLEIINEDALKKDFSGIFPEGNVYFTGNLPYNLSVKIFEKTAFVKNMNSAVFMFQKEVADRIAAKPGTRQYSSLSVFASYFFSIQKIRDIGGANFFPNAKVMSTVLKFIPRNNPPLQGKDEDNFLRLIRKAFAQKRKILKNNLKCFENLNEAILKSGLKENIRAEEMDMKDFLKLYGFLYDKPAVI